MNNSIFLYHITYFLLIAKIADLDKIAILSANLALFSKTAIFAISKKQIVWHKTIELFMVNH